MQQQQQQQKTNPPTSKECSGKKTMYRGKMSSGKKGVQNPQTRSATVGSTLGLPMRCWNPHPHSQAEITGKMGPRHVHVCKLPSRDDSQSWQPKEHRDIVKESNSQQPWISLGNFCFCRVAHAHCNSHEEMTPLGVWTLRKQTRTSAQGRIWFAWIYLLFMWTFPF